MTRALLCLLAAGAAPAQTLLHEWDFGRGPGEWFAAHNVGLLRVEGGALVIPVEGPDPYIHCSRGDCLAIDGNPRQFIRLRFAGNVAGAGEFFWAATTAGRDQGFVAGQEIHFTSPGDGRWREIDIYPGWQGRITRLRLDPPGGEKGDELRVSRIAIYEWPPSGQRGPRWDLAGDHANWMPLGDTAFAVGPDGLALAGERAAVATTLEFEPPADPWLSVSGTARTPARLDVRWRGAERTFGATIRVPAGAWRRTLRCTDHGGGPTRDTRLELRCAGAEGLTLRSVALLERPDGPPELAVLGVEFDRAVSLVDQPARVRLEVQNVGGEMLPAGSFEPFERVEATDVETRELPAPRAEHPPLAPGETRSLELVVAAPDSAWRLVGRRGGASVEQIRLPAEVTEPGPGPSVSDVAAALCGERIRLRAPAVATGFAMIALEIQDAGRWRTVAWLPPIGAVMTEPGRWTEPPPADAEARYGALVFAVEAPGAWRAETVYRLAGADRFSAEHRFTALRPTRLYHFGGPWLRVGDGGPGAARYEGLFPGLEYLGADVQPDEVSSSDRDVHAPLDLRAVPHRHNITIPLQAVTLPNHDLVALLWSHDAAGDGPAAVFGSPNLIERAEPAIDAGQPGRSGANHLLGLFLPAVPEHTPENGLVAERPLELRAGQTVTIRAQLLAAPQAEVLDAVDAWIGVYRPPAAGQVSAGLKPLLQRCRDGFENVLWVEGQGWIGAPERPHASLDPRIAELYRYLALLLEEPELRTKAERRLPASGDLALSLHQGGVIEALGGAAEGARAALAGRRDDGAWVFEPDEQHAELGPQGETNVGIIAPKVAGVLRAARVTADEGLLAKGIESLATLRRYRVPRGAQVWEVPLHCPDILASGRAVEALVLGYELTGDRQWLDKADYWARTALPFIYHWQHPRADLAPMRGGSIPVFGASVYTNAWFGRLVQWNGLAVALALDDLAAVGGSERWREVAEDLIVSGQRQQRGDPAEPYLGLYPDFWNMRTGIPGFWLNPSLLLQAALRHLGYTPGGSWLAARSAGKLWTIVSPTPLREPRAGGVSLGRVAQEVSAPFELTCGVDYPLGPTAHVAIVGVGEPTEVRLDGAAVPRSATLDTAEDGWLYAADLAALVVRVDHRRAARRQLAVSGLRPADPASRSDRSWRFIGGRHGWGQMCHNLRTEPSAEGLRCIAEGDDPYFSGPPLDHDSAGIERIVIRAKSTVAGTPQIFWSNEAGGYSPAHSLSGPELPADGQFHDLVFAVAGRPGWAGRLLRLRIDPPGGAGAVMVIEEIRFEP